MRRLLLSFVIIGSTEIVAQPVVSWTPSNPSRDDVITIKIQNAQQAAYLHWGVNDDPSSWNMPHPTYWPSGSFLAFGAVESPLSGTGAEIVYIGPFNNLLQNINSVAFVIRYADTSWDNNNGMDYHITFSPTLPNTEFIIDGNRDSNSVLVAQRGLNKLFAGWNGVDFYVATNVNAGIDKDIFVLLSRDPAILTPAVSSWNKRGTTGRAEFFLGRESTNSWTGWFDSSSAVYGIGRSTSGDYLEGSLPLRTVDSTFRSIYLAVGYYETRDSGSLVYQIPSGNGDLSVDPTEWVLFNLVLTHVTKAENHHVPSSLELSCYPNPFNPSTTIRCGIPRRSHIRLAIFNTLGQEIAELANEEMNAGYFERHWNANVASGIYFYRLEAVSVTDGERFVDVKKMILLK